MLSQVSAHSGNKKYLTGLSAWVQLSILFSLFLWSGFHSPSVEATSCPDQAVSDIGDNACGCNCSSTDTDAGSARSGLLPGMQAGNPISLVSGNKYQQELDYRAPGSELQLRRHYNSTNGDMNVGWGRGWSISYSTYILQVVDNEKPNGFEIVQSDGRRILFHDEHSDENGRVFYRSPSASDGYVIQLEDGHSNWHLPEGKVLSFYGSYLTRIDYPGAAFLSMHYQGGRLSQVIDEADRVLKFEYTAGRIGLNSYDSQSYGEQAGHIRKVTLPNGSELHYDFDSQLNLTRIRYPDNIDRQYHYENTNWPQHLTGITDQNNNRYASWEYNEEGRAIRSEHANGVELIDVSYTIPPENSDTDVGITEITNSLGEVSRYTWLQDKQHGRVRLLSGTGPGCASCPPTGVKYEYDSSRQLKTVTHENGQVTEYDYDDQGRVVFTSNYVLESSLPDETRWTRYEYDGAINQPSLIARPSVNNTGEHQVQIEYNQDRLPVAYTERGYTPNTINGVHSYEAITRTTFLRYENGLLAEIDGPRIDVADISFFHYDQQRRLTSVDLPSGQTIYFSEYDADGRPTVFQIEQQSPTTLTYDNRGNVTRINRRGHSINYNHDALGNLISIVDADGKTVTFDYDTAGRITEFTDDLGRRSTLTRDTESRITDKSVYGINGELISSLSYVFDGNGRIQESHERRFNVTNSNELNRQVNYQYDEANRLTSAQDGKTGSEVDLNYNPFGQLAGFTRPDGVRNLFHYNKKGDVAGKTDSRNNRTDILRDDFGRIVKYTSPDTGIAYYQYDSADNRILKIDADGDSFNYRWDAANRLKEISSPDGVSYFEYDSNSGKLSLASNPYSSDIFEYDIEGQIVSHISKIDNQTFITRYTYTTEGNPQSKTLPDGISLRYGYHETGQNKGSLSSITQYSLFGLKHNKLLSEIDNDARDGQSGYISHNGLRTSMQFAPDGSVQSVDIENTLNLEYQYDIEGQIVGINENNNAQYFQYNAGRLNNATTLSGNYQYSYDPVGNRTSKVETTANGTNIVTHYTYTRPGMGNRLLSEVDSVSGIRKEYRYTPSGAPTTSARSLRYEYNAEQRPIVVYRDEAVLARYSYNSFGQRIKKVTYNNSKTKVTYYLYDGNQLTAQIEPSTTDDTNAFKHTLYIDHAPVHYIDNGKHYAVHGDHIGTPRTLTDHKQQTIWQAHYSPFGEATIVKSDIQFDHRFSGQIEDTETGTHYNYFRDYDPATGRYITSDPIGLQGGDNTYTYVDGMPLSSIDPLGLQENALEAPERTTVRLFLQSIGTSQVGSTTAVAANSAARATALIRLAAYVNGPVSTVANTAYYAGYTAAALYNYIQLQRVDVELLVEQIQRYNPGFESPNESPSWELINELGLELSTARYDYFYNELQRRQEAFQQGSCSAFNDELFDEARDFIYFDNLGILDSPGTWISPEGLPFQNEDEYLEALRDFEQARADGEAFDFIDYIHGLQIEDLQNRFPEIDMSDDDGPVIREGILWPSEAAYRAERANYWASGAELAGISFADWWATQGGSGSTTDSSSGDSDPPEDETPTAGTFGNVPDSIDNTAGVNISPTPGVTTTILGSFRFDTNDIINNQLNYPETYDFGAKPGGYNVLNVPPGYDPATFWEDYNVPFLDAAISRGDIIVLASPQNNETLVNAQGRPSGFAREIDYLEARGYRYNPATGAMER